MPVPVPVPVPVASPMSTSVRMYTHVRMHRCGVKGPEDTPWEGRVVRLALRFCGIWPFQPPLLFVLHPRPLHPNIDSHSGAVCMDLLQEQWSPAGGVLAVRHAPLPFTPFPSHAPLPTVGTSRRFGRAPFPRSPTRMRLIRTPPLHRTLLAALKRRQPPYCSHPLAYPSAPCWWPQVLLSFRSLLATPTLDDAASLPADLDAARMLLHEPTEYEKRNKELAAAMPTW